MIIGMGISAQANSFEAYNFQSFDQFYVAQKQAEVHERAKGGNIGNYEVGGENNYYIGSASIDGFQQNNNIGNINNITGDGNSVEQQTKGQSNDAHIN